jgi:hypothetical protein
MIYTGDNDEHLDDSWANFYCMEREKQGERLFLALN